MNRIPTRGVVPAALTPFAPDLSIDLPAFRRHLTDLAEVPGITAVMVNGAAGQDAALSRQERRDLLAEAVAAVGDRTPILAALREAAGMTLAELAVDAASCGVDALLVMPPPDSADFATDRALARFEQVIAAADLPIAFYQTRYETETVVALAALPPVFAIKEGNGNPAVFERNLRAVRALDRGVAVWSTHSSWLLADLAVGADGILSGAGSVIADLQAELAAAVWASDLPAARRVSDRLFGLNQAFYRPGLNPHTRMKYALRRLGRWTYEAVRPPLEPVDAAEQAQLDDALRASGLLPVDG